MVNELLAEIAEARAADKAAEDRAERIRLLLIDVRKKRPELTIADIEAMIDRYYDRATISRKTSKALAGVPRPKRTRKRRGA